MTTIDDFRTNDEIQDEDDRLRSANELRREWWMADMDYLPIHFFRKDMKKVCYELSTFPSAKRLTEILQDIPSKWTSGMCESFDEEYEFYYGNGLIDWNAYKGRQVMGGYVADMTMLLSKLLCIYVRRTQGIDRGALWNMIDTVYMKFFDRPRDWPDDNLDRIDVIMHRLRKDGGSRTSG